MKTRITVCVLGFAISQFSAFAAGPRVTFRCAQDHSSRTLVLKVRNDGPDSLVTGTTVYYFYRTSQSDMSVTGSHQLNVRLDKGDIFTIQASQQQTEITECGCSLRPFTPTARTTRKAGQSD